MNRPTRKALGVATLLTLPAAADVNTYSGVNAGYQPARDDFVADHLLLTGVPIAFESFDALNPADSVGDMPGNPGRFAPEFADGSPAPLPEIQVFTGAPSPPHWMRNFGSGRPAGSSWVIRPDNPGDSIYAFAQTNAQGDWVRVIGEDADGNAVVSIDASNQGLAFAGFISTIPIARVVVTPLGNADLLNGMDDVFVGVAPAAMGCSPADLAKPYTVFDLADVNAFVSGFVSGDPIADLDDNGLFDLTDIGTFIAAFLAGCP
jgi:hypothetical protein